MSVYDCATPQGDIQVFERGSRTFATYTSEDTSALNVDSDCVQQAVEAGDIVFKDVEGGGENGDAPDGEPDSKEPGYGTYIVDITDPAGPTYGGFVPVPEGSHNNTVDPSGSYFYNSDSALITDTTPQIQIYDIRDLDNITRVNGIDVPVRPGLGTSSHDIEFNADGTRMYSAALALTVIYDTTDLANPVEISNFIDPAIDLHLARVPHLPGAGDHHHRLVQRRRVGARHQRSGGQRGVTDRHADQHLGVRLLRQLRHLVVQDQSLRRGRFLLRVRQRHHPWPRHRPACRRR